MSRLIGPRCRLIACVFVVMAVTTLLSCATWGRDRRWRSGLFDRAPASESGVLALPAPDDRERVEVP